MHVGGDGDVCSLGLGQERPSAGSAGSLRTLGLDLNHSYTESGIVPPENILWAFYNTCYGGSIMLMGRLKEADPILQESLTMLAAHDPATQWIRACCLLMLASTAYYKGDFHLAISCLKEGIDLFKATQDMWNHGVLLWFQGIVEAAQGNLSQHQQLLEESVRLLSKMEDQKFLGAALNELGRSALYQGNLDLAETYAQLRGKGFL